MANTSNRNLKKPESFKNPPRIAEWFFRKIFHDADIRTGDFEEVYNALAHEKGPFRARLWYWLQIIISLKPFLENIFGRSIGMFKNYLKIALRNIRKQKVYSFINISGLAIGITCCLLIVLYVQTELSYDKKSPLSENTYRVDLLRRDAQDWAITPANWVQDFAFKLPEVKKAVRVNPSWGRASLTSYNDKKFYEKKFFWSDSTVFEFFAIEFVAGDPKSALSRPNTIVLTEETAEKYFGDEDPLGKLLRRNATQDYEVTGVVKKLVNSHFDFDFIAYLPKVISGGWVWTFLHLDENTSISNLEDKLNTIYAEMSPERAKRLSFTFTPIEDIHLRSHLGFEIGANGNILYIYIFSVIAFLILLIACINFMNLSTARSITRAKEVGMRKVMGAVRSQLIKQFLGESVLMTAIAFIAAVTLVQLILPTFNTMFDLNITLSQLNFTLFVVLIGFVLGVGFIAGSYPAFFLSQFSPLRVLKNNLSGTTSSHNLRRFLVTVQFTISIFLIIGTVIVSNQLSFVKSKSLGFDKDQILVINNNDRTLVSKMESIKSQLMEDPNVLQVSAISNVPGQYDLMPSGAAWYEGLPQGESITLPRFMADYAFVQTLGLEILKGRDLSQDLRSDTATAIIINETAAKNFGWGEPIGKRIRTNSKPNGIVVGVVKDFHFRSLHDPIGPLGIEYHLKAANVLAIKLRGGDIQSTVTFLEEKWKTIDPNRPFNYFFLNEDFDRQYRSDEKVGSIFTYFATLAIIISSLGLFGLTSFTVERRTKEIGIRKVLGASPGQIVRMVGKEFARLLLVANVVSWPIAYYASSQWLQAFAYQTNVGIMVFLLSGIAAIAMAMMTIAYQSVSAALKNPVISIKYE